MVVPVTARWDVQQALGSQCSWEGSGCWLDIRFWCPGLTLSNSDSMSVIFFFFIHQRFWDLARILESDIDSNSNSNIY